MLLQAALASAGVLAPLGRLAGGPVGAALRAAGYASLLASVLLLFFSSLIDYFSLALSLGALAVSLVAGWFAAGYGAREGYGRSMPALVDAFGVLLAAALASPSMLWLVVAWSLAEIAGYMLVREGEEHSTEGSLRAARGFIFTSTLTFELTAFTAIVTSLSLAATGLGVAGLLAPFGSLPPSGVPAALVPLLLLGFVTKAALVPLHFWLPSAHTAAPSPASALLSGVSTSLGFYGLYRLAQLFDLSQCAGAISLALAALGLASIAYGGLQAFGQRDGKLLLAYATVMTNGFVALAFSMLFASPGCGLCHALALASILMHMAYKATLFCDMGVIEAYAGTRYIHGISGFAEKAAASSAGSAMAIFTMMGVPGTIGFAAKLLALFASVSGMLSGGGPAFYAAFAGAAAYTALSALLAVRLMGVYMKSPRARAPLDIGGAPLPFQLPVLALGVSNLAFPLLLFATQAAWVALFSALALPLPAGASLIPGAASRRWAPVAR